MEGCCGGLIHRVMSQGDADLGNVPTVVREDTRVGAEALK